MNMEHKLSGGLLFYLLIYSESICSKQFLIVLIYPYINSRSRSYGDEHGSTQPSRKYGMTTEQKPQWWPFDLPSEPLQWPPPPSPKFMNTEQQLRRWAFDIDGYDEQWTLDKWLLDLNGPPLLAPPISSNGIFGCSVKSWQKGDFLGSGSFGTVYEGFTDDGSFFAVKEVSLIDQGTRGNQSILQLKQEISLLSRFQHENIVRYLGTDSDDRKLYIFLELVTKGSLASLYKKYHLMDSQVSTYTRQILNVLNYLHKQNVVHRDIKCANILVHACGSVKLADFGLAKATTLNDINSFKGTAFWMAPEMQALFRIGRGKRPRIPNSLSTDAQDFIVKCLQINPDKRPTAAQLLDHPFVSC